MIFFVRFLRGEKPLWQSFWVMLVAVHMIARLVPDWIAGVGTVGYLMINWFLWVYQVLALIGAWKSANNYVVTVMHGGEGRLAWGYLARAVMIFLVFSLIGSFFTILGTAARG